MKARWVFLTAFALVFYGNGAAFIESFGAVWVAIALQAIVWVSTATIQVPIQLQLSAEGLSLPLIERLIETNFWLRRIPYAACAGLFLWMASRALQASDVIAPIHLLPRLDDGIVVVKGEKGRRP